MNYSTFIVKILNQPKTIFFKQNFLVTEVWVQFPQIRLKSAKNQFKIFVWGDFSLTNYHINDYVIIEGYIAMSNVKPQNKIEVSVLKIYPFVLNEKKNVQ